MRRIILFISLISVMLGVGGGATELHVSKSGADVVLTWTGGTAPYRVVRSTNPLFYFSNALLAENYYNTSLIDAEGLITSDRYYYDVSGVGETPADEANPAVPPPIITSLNPDSGKPGDTVLIYGNNFAPGIYDNEVDFGIYRAQVTAASITQLTVTVPPEAITDVVVVSVGTLWSNGVMFHRLYGAASYSDLSSIAFEKGNGSVWVADRGTTDKMIEIFPDETQVQLASLAEMIISNIDPITDAWIYYGNSTYSSSNTGRISRLEVAGNTTALFRQIGSTSDPVQVLAITPDSIDGTIIFVSDGYRRSIRRVPQSGTIIHAYGGLTNMTFTNPSGLRCDSEGNLWATTTNKLVKITPGQVVTDEVTGLNGAAGIDITESMGFPQILIAEKNTGNIYLYSSLSKILSTVATGLNNPVGVSFSENLATGELFYEVIEPTRILRLPDPKIEVKLGKKDKRILIHKYEAADQYPSSCQTQDGKIKVEVELKGYSILPEMVYFRVKDPKDESPYALSPEDNDNKCGAGILSSAFAPVDPNGKASVELTITDRCSGDNYRVEVSLTSDFAKIEAKTPVLEAWKRIYIEKDRMYKTGIDLSAASGKDYPPANWVRIAYTSMFGNGDQVHVLSYNKGIGEYATIESISFNDHLVLTTPLTENYPKEYEGAPVYPHVAKVADGLYDISTSVVNDVFDKTYKEMFIEFVNLSAEQNDKSKVPYNIFDNITSGTLWTLSLWFNDDIMTSKVWKKNRIHLIVGKKYTGNPPEDPPSKGKSDSPQDFVLLCMDQIGSSQEILKDVLAHEIGHLFRVNPLDPNGHCDKNPWNSGDFPADKCLMNESRIINDNNQKLHVVSVTDSDLYECRLQIDDFSTDNPPLTIKKENSYEK